MSDDKSKNKKKKKYRAPKGRTTEHSLGTAGGKLEYKATAAWIVLTSNEKPRAEMFHVAYIKKGETSSNRPLTFVFNGGPGASSAYLHVGAIGPKRVVLREDGTPDKPPAHLAEEPAALLG